MGSAYEVLGHDYIIVIIIIIIILLSSRKNHTGKEGIGLDLLRNNLYL